MSVCLQTVVTFLGASSKGKKVSPAPSEIALEKEKLGAIKNLPIELIALILSYLKPIDLARCLCVNRYLCRTVNQVFVNKTPVVNSILSLRLEAAKPLNDAAVALITKCFVAANEVELTSTEITGKALTCVALNLRCIDRFCLLTISPKGFENIQKGALKAFVKAHPEITRLQIDRCPNLQADEIEEVILTCQKLVALSLNSNQLNPKLIKKIARRHPNLQRLILAGGRKVDDRTLEVIALKCSKLQFLIIHGCEKVSPRGVEQLLQLTELASFSLDDCKESAVLTQWMLHRKKPPQLKSYHFYGKEE